MSMEELMRRLDQINDDMSELDTITNLIKRETDLLEFFDTVENLDNQIQTRGKPLHSNSNSELSPKPNSAYQTAKEQVKNMVDTYGIEIYNDTNSTTPDATIAGLLALKKIKVLIMGGADKKLDMTKLVDIVSMHVERIILLPGTGTDAIRLKILDSGFKNVEEVKSLKEAVEKAVAFCETGDALLFSPAFASFGLFKNEYDRGDQFNAIIESLN